MIGSLYTRGQLMAMENVRKDYGHGSLTPRERPKNPLNCQAAYGQYGANFIGPDDNRVYLTFDCGYEHTVNGQRVTEMILDALKEKDAKAVFFVTDYYCHQSPDLIRRMIDEGHAVGNHTSNHPVMPGQSIEKMVYEVTSLHNYVLENFGYAMKLFRPPTGAYSTRSLAVVQSLGYETVNWSFAHVDWDPANQPAYEAALTRVVNGAHNGTIYLLHAVSLTNAQILGEAIDQIRGLGYEIALFE
jgi:peptidoglycan-N-acetylmuramic acid deacetylase